MGCWGFVPSLGKSLFLSSRATGTSASLEGVFRTEDFDRPLSGVRVAGEPTTVYERINAPKRESECSSRRRETARNSRGAPSKTASARK